MISDTGDTNFLGLDRKHSSRDGSRVLVLPIPYEATTSYGSGTRRGPEAIITASQQVELYDPKTSTEAAMDLGFHTLAPLSQASSPEEMLSVISACSEKLYKSGQFLLALGGEHSISVGLIRAAAQKWADLCIVQVDAHADLRDEYGGTPLSHACTARRGLDELENAEGTAQLIQVGIRNISAEGDRFRRSNEGRIQTFWAEDILEDSSGSWLDKIQKLVSRRNVYLTFDLDGLDSSIMPSTGTPEPGGLLWQHATKLVEALATSAKLVAADIVELAPLSGNHAPDFLAAKLAYIIATQALKR